MPERSAGRLLEAGNRCGGWSTFQSPVASPLAPAERVSARPPSGRPNFSAPSVPVVGSAAFTGFPGAVAWDDSTCSALGVGEAEVDKVRF